MPDYRLSLMFSAPDDATAAKRGEDIADLAAAEHGTRNPVVVRVDGELRDRIARRVRDDVRLRLGPRAVEQAADGPIMLSGTEADAIADAALAEIAPELERLRAKARSARNDAVRQRARAESAVEEVERLRAELAEARTNRIVSAIFAYREADTPRPFALHRRMDHSGVSGTGTVAYGAVFGDGTTVIRWCGDRPSTVVWADLETAMAVHGHGGATELVWLAEQFADLAEIEARAERAEQAEAEIATLTASVAEYQRQIGYLRDDVKRVEAERGALKAAIEQVRADLIAAQRSTGAADQEWLDGIQAHVKRAVVMLGAALDTPTVPESRVRPVSVSSPGNDGFRYEPTPETSGDAEEAKTNG